MHGLRDPVLPRGLSAGQPDPRLERPRLPRQVARGDRPAAHHQQLPRVHRPDLPRSVRVGVRAGDQRRPGDDRADRDGDRRAGVPGGLDRSRAAGPPHREDGRGRGRRAGRAGRGRRAQPLRSHGDRVRARRGTRRADAIWRARRQAREVDHRPARGHPRAGGHRVRLQRRRGPRHPRRAAARPLRRTRRVDRFAGVARSAGTRPGARGHPPGDGLPVPAQSLGGRRAGPPAPSAGARHRDHRQGQARDRGRRRRHRDGLHLELQPRGRAQRPHARRVRRPRRRRRRPQAPLAAAAQADAHDIRARRGRKAPLGDGGDRLRRDQRHGQSRVRPQRSPEPRLAT